MQKVNSILTNCKATLSIIPIRLCGYFQPQVMTISKQRKLLKIGFRQEICSLFTSCQPINISHIFLASTMECSNTDWNSEGSKFAMENDIDKDLDHHDNNTMVTSPVSPGSQTPHRSTSSLSTRIKSRRPVCRPTTRTRGKSPGCQGNKGSPPSILQRRPQRRRSRSVSAPQQRVRVRKRSTSVSRLTISCTESENATQEVHCVRFSENVMHPMETSAEMEDSLRGRSSFRTNERTRRSPTPFCRNVVPISSEDEDEDGDTQEDNKHNDSAEQLNIPPTPEPRKHDSSQKIMTGEGDGFYKEVDEDREMKTAKATVRFACQNLSPKIYEGQDEMTGPTTPRTKVNGRSRRAPTPFVRRVYEDTGPSDSEGEENDDRSSKTGDSMLAMTSENDLNEDEYSPTGRNDDGNRSHPRKREPSPMGDEVVQKVRVPLRERYGNNLSVEPGEGRRVRQVQFSDLPSRDWEDDDSGLKKVSSRRPTPFGLREFSVDGEVDE